MLAAIKRSRVTKKIEKVIRTQRTTVNKSLEVNSLMKISLSPCLNGRCYFSFLKCIGNDNSFFVLKLSLLEITSFWNHAAK